jgi:hypothetical protein
MVSSWLYGICPDFNCNTRPRVRRWMSSCHAKIIVSSKVTLFLPTIVIFYYVLHFAHPFLLVVWWRLAQSPIFSKKICVPFVACASGYNRRKCDWEINSKNVIKFCLGNKILKRGEFSHSTFADIFIWRLWVYHRYLSENKSLFTLQQYHWRWMFLNTIYYNK